MTYGTVNHNIVELGEYQKLAAGLPSQSHEVVKFQLFHFVKSFPSFVWNIDV